MIAPEETQLQTERISVQAPSSIPVRMVEDYVNRCITALPVVKTALERLAYGDVRVFGHRLRGTGGAYGIPVLTEMGSAIEEAAQRSNTAELQRQVAALEAYLSRIEIV